MFMMCIGSLMLIGSITHASCCVLVFLICTCQLMFIALLTHTCLDEAFLVRWRSCVLMFVVIPRSVDCTIPHDMTVLLAAVSGILPTTGTLSCGSTLKWFGTPASFVLSASESASPYRRSSPCQTTRISQPGKRQPVPWRQQGHVRRCSGSLAYWGRGGNVRRPYSEVSPVSLLDRCARPMDGYVITSLEAASRLWQTTKHVRGCRCRWKCIEIVRVLVS